MNAPEAEWQVIHEPRNCFDLILVQVEAKRLPIGYVRCHGNTSTVCINSVELLFLKGKPGGLDDSRVASGE